ncbi:sulfotransferase domain-containing protein [Nonomuraea cavernae]|uniref:Heparan sulfate glucosamine 3-O-sulfotransferase 3B1 n=1 Tax=Nonomuraea cavernae TaxID=2045107 RepID=A0A918DK07_9ACTN|nr:sulfotransferase domain-containing protein [Nonomuraea cavernae]MCA2186086.1 sulfotransferase domain-containing protein [Nonomuraea cavernae]GGO70252.1 heparan sulfate glucosamine 3-O-sulfotransferase 3B1 [Nonomuraea cavernae]
MLSRRSAPPFVKQIGRSVTRQVGLATSRARMLPGFLLVGTQRGGTTSLWRALTAHPAVVPPLFHKGVHYFDVNYPRGRHWYRGHFPVRALATRRASAPPVTGESAGYYMHHPLAPGRIAKDLPGVRLLVVLRDPVERAYSAHMHELARGFETEPFERALELEPQRLDGELARIEADPGYVSHSHRHHSYVDRGHYADQLDRLFTLFGRDRVHVLFAEDLFAGFEREYDRILAFLGLPSWRPATLGRDNARPRSPMPESVRRDLDAHFLPYDERLARLLGVVPPWRR